MSKFKSFIIMVILLCITIRIINAKEPIPIASSKSLEDVKCDLNEFRNNLGEYIASSFDISLQNYEKINIFELEESDNNFELVKLYFDIPKEPRDKKPQIYLKNGNESFTEGFIIMQKSDGTNKIYYLELDDSAGWVIKSEDSAQGQLMNFETE